MTLAILVQESSLLLRWTLGNLYVCSMCGCLSGITISFVLLVLIWRWLRSHQLTRSFMTPPVFQFVLFWKMSNNGCVIQWTSGCDSDMYSRQKERALYTIGPLASPWAVMDVLCWNWKGQKTQPCAGGRWLHGISAAWSWCHLVLWLSPVFLSLFLTWSTVMERLRGIMLHSWYSLCSLVSTVMISILLGRNITFPAMTDGLYHFFFWLFFCPSALLQPCIHSSFSLTLQGSLVSPQRVSVSVAVPTSVLQCKQQNCGWMDPLLLFLAVFSSPKMWKTYYNFRQLHIHSIKCQQDECRKEKESTLKYT